MGEPLRRTAGYLKSLVNVPYGISDAVAGAFNYLLDSYFSKVDERAAMAHQVAEYYPADPDSHLKELWLDCEIHTALSLNRSYPGFARSLNSWAFTRLFKNYGVPEAVYEIVPLLDQYKFKDMLKGRSGYRIQYEQLSIDLGKFETLPIFGNFFIRNIIDDSHLFVLIDLCYNSSQCNFLVIVNPSQQAAAENFYRDLNASIQANDIYFQKCLTFQQGSLDFTAVTPTVWEDIVLKDNVKCAIRDNTVEVLKHMEALASIGMCPNRNTILISQPGMAKTTVFRAISLETEGQATRIWCTGKSIEYAEHVTALFQAARTLAPCIIFIEDMDCLTGDRNNLMGHDSRILNEFLACLDGAQANTGVVVIASTNDVASMDEAMIRPGRFDIKIEVPFPDREERITMLGSFFRHLNVKFDSSVNQEFLYNISDLLDQTTGAHIKEFCKSAVIRSVALGKLTDGHPILNSEILTHAANILMEGLKIQKLTHVHHKYSDTSFPKK